MDALRTDAETTQGSGSDAFRPLSFKEAEALVSSWRDALQSPCVCNEVPLDRKESLSKMIGEIMSWGGIDYLEELGAVFEKHPNALSELEALRKQWQLSQQETAIATLPEGGSIPTVTDVDGYADRLSNMLRRFETRNDAIDGLTSEEAATLEVETALELDQANRHHNIMRAILRSIHAGTITLSIPGEESECLFTKKHARAIGWLSAKAGRGNATFQRSRTSEDLPSIYDGKTLGDWQTELFQLAQMAWMTLDDEFRE